jgi:hypothetical protein
MIENSFLLRLEKTLRCYLPPKVELKIFKKKIFKILDKIKNVVYMYHEISNKNDF